MAFGCWILTGLQITTIRTDCQPGLLRSAATFPFPYRSFDHVEEGMRIRDLDVLKLLASSGIASGQFAQQMRPFEEKLADCFGDFFTRAQEREFGRIEMVAAV